MSQAAAVATNFMTIFVTIFLSELGDKNQLATLVFAAQPGRSALVVFVAATTALCVSTFVAIAIGKAATQYIHRLPMGLISGIMFIMIGIFAIYEHFEAQS